MCFIRKIFKRSTTSNKGAKELNINWIPLIYISQLEEIKEQSNSEIIAIFKHSTRCEISRKIIELFEKSFDKENKNLKAYYLDILNYRDISNEIEQQFRVPHQSPQLLVIDKGEVVTHASHYDIIPT